MLVRFRSILASGAPAVLRSQSAPQPAHAASDDPRQGVIRFSRLSRLVDAACRWRTESLKLKVCMCSQYILLALLSATLVWQPQSTAGAIWTAQSQQSTFSTVPDGIAAKGQGEVMGR